MPGVAREGDCTFCMSADVEGGPLSPAASIGVMVEGAPLIRLADSSSCATHGTDVVGGGSATVLVCGFPVTRHVDVVLPLGIVNSGSDSVEIGGPSFQLPANFELSGPPEFLNATIRDLYLISTLPSGKELLRRLGESGFPIQISPESDPHNSYTTRIEPPAPPPDPGDWMEGMNEDPAGSSITYNPNSAAYDYGMDGSLIPSPPTVGLAHELCHALRNAQGYRTWPQTDPKAPPSEPDIGISEAFAIGVGTYDGQAPSENSIRRDLGIPERANHLGETTTGAWWTETWATDWVRDEITEPTGDVRPTGRCASDPFVVFRHAATEAVRQYLLWVAHNR